MNFNKHTFTVKEFMALPVYELAKEAPIGENFLLKGRQSKQQEYLEFLIKEHTEEGIVKNIEQQKRAYPKTDHRLKVVFWRKWKDGNIGEFGGTIAFDAPGLSLKDDKLVINMGDDNLTLGVGEQNVA